MGWIVAALAFAVLFFVPGLLQQFDVPKIEAVRVCGLAALAASVIAGRAGRLRRCRALDVAVVAWLAVESIATACSVSPRLSLLGEPRQREGLLTSLALAGLYFAGRDVFSLPGRARLALTTLVACATVASLYAIAQVTGNDVFQWRREAVYAGGYVRPFATLGHPNLLGVVTAAAAAVATAIALATRRGAERWMMLLLGALCLMATVLTLSRAAWLAVAIALPIAALLALAERPERGAARRVLAAAGIFIVALVIATLMTGRGHAVAERMAESTEGGSAASRVEIWRTALAAFRARPITGQGPDAFELTFPRFQTVAYWRYEWAGLPVHAHDIALHALATRGVIGLLAGLAWAIALLAMAWRAWRARARTHEALGGIVPAAVAMLLAVMIAGIFGAIGITGALIVTIGTALIATVADAASAPAPAERSAAPKPRKRERPAARARTARPPAGARVWVARVAAFAVAVVAFLWGFAELRASRAASAAQSWMTAAPDRAVPAAEVATTLAPHEDRMWRMLAECLLWRSTTSGSPTGDVSDAAAAARRAVALEPERAENHVILARALGAREGLSDTLARAETRAEFERALALAPMDGLTLMEWADHESFAGRGEAALVPAQRVVALYPTEGAAHTSLARAFLAAGHRDSALTEIDRALSGVWRNQGEKADAEALKKEILH